MLREPHAVTGDYRLGVAIHLGRRFNFSARQTSAGFDIAPLEQLHSGGELLEPARILGNELNVNGAIAAVGLRLVQG